MKIGIVGNGMIVNMFLKNALHVEHATITALCVRSRSMEKGKALAAQYEIPRLFTDYDKFLSCENFETVYIGISNLVHFEYAKKALEAGKHVILEKPFTVNSVQARELETLAKEKKLFLWEAFMIPYLPPYAKIKSSLPKVGNIKLIQANYSKISSRYVQYMNGTILPAFDPALAGGALYDLNIYNLHLIIGLLGKPVNAWYYPTNGYNGVDTSGIAILEYESFHASCSAAKDSTSPSGFMIQGDQGCLYIEGPASTLSKIIFSNETSQETLAEFDGQLKLSYELREFIRQYEENDFDSCYEMLKHSIAVTEVVDLLLTSNK